MKRRDLIRKLKKAGWEISSGAKHDMATHKDRPGFKLPIPRHTEINEYTAKQILKEVGLK
ncbi:MAG TPA: type II toxin-antitoxin system HicA family toxin [Thermoanaerobacterales bacterium]|uniref:type II toxin-antitoxin system HicA family toxin n=1 Tax=Tepidanaerobacter sp. GT38 TaxID=2722793 RepID=UPI0018342F5A|nr:type II toxin-antitoxin system HicA family toxin [Tepidanaerobacter sp. GT38]MCG1012850.1 type II toxin-antitoxin system HicA family toxin [Tepidanaerobacter sp. GT38]HHY41496.1 type II toxin-antitoxin system HicA family toxin [Thermoanaerobacterales bacterium]